MSLFIVTYHYVRPLKKTKYPNLKALDISKFEKQITISEEKHYYYKN